MMTTKKLSEIPDCHYSSDPILVRPAGSTPKGTLYLSNLDDQRFLRFSIKYLYLFKTAVPVDTLTASLSKVLVEYYPLAGRLRPAAPASGAGGDEGKLEVDCNGEGAVMAQGSVEMTAAEFLECSDKPKRSWRKLLYEVRAQSSAAGVPPLVVQVTNLSCGGMVLCIAISHCLCDGIGSSQFLRRWAQFARGDHDGAAPAPFHGREMLKPRCPPRVDFLHPEYINTAAGEAANSFDISQYLVSQPLTPVLFTFNAAHILHLKKQCGIPPRKCTSFEVLATHVWRAWVKTLDLPPSLRVKLLFSLNVREKLKPALPDGFYGNGFAFACAEASAERLLNSGTQYGVTLVQEAKDRIGEDYVRSIIDLLDGSRKKPDLSSTLVISSWTRYGLEDLDLGVSGTPIHMCPLTSEIFCVFAPVPGDPNSVTMIISVPESVSDKFGEFCRKGVECSDRAAKDDLELHEQGKGYSLVAA